METVVRTTPNLMKNSFFMDLELYIYMIVLHWEGNPLSHLFFSLIAAPKFVWKEKIILKFFAPQIIRNMKSKWLFLKILSELVSMQEVPVCLWVSSSLVDSISILFHFLGLWGKYLFVKNLRLEIKLRSLIIYFDGFPPPMNLHSRLPLQ